MKSIIFDLDGTLIKFKIKWLEVKREIIESIGNMGIEKKHFSIKDGTQHILDKIEIFAESYKLDSMKAKEKIYRIIEKYEVEASYKAELCDGAKEVLKLLKPNLKLGLVTNNGRRAVSIVLDKHNLRDFFDVILVRENVKKLKPYPEGLERALGLLKADPKVSFYIGDSVYDVEACRRAGLKAIAILGGISSKEDLIKAKPDYLISSLRELTYII
ncbi:MAG: HAD family hydrolase [Nitrososphaerales archaeon]